MVFLPLSLPEAVLIKTFNVSEYTQEDRWRDVTAVCSLKGMFIKKSDSKTKLTLLSVGDVLFMLN